MQELNLCEILRGHEGETFYSPICGDILFYQIDSNKPYPIRCSKKTRMIDFTSKGEFYKDYNGECVIFPSKDQRDWNKWIEEQEPKTPKTWSELVKENKYQPYFAEIHIRFSSKDKCTCGKNPIEKSALALLKIHQLIEVGYGGNITDEEWRNINIKKYYFIPNTEYSPDEEDNMWEIVYAQTYPNKRTFAFRTGEQAEEFLSYPENVKLLKDYFMI